MRLSIDEARTFACEILQKHGLIVKEAEQIADILIEAELYGRKTHGIARIPGIIKALRNSNRRPMKILKDESSFFNIDGGENPGYLVATELAYKLIEKLNSSPIVIGGAYNTNHASMIGYYVMKVVEAGYIAIAMAGCQPFVAPWGSRDAIFGTNPLTIGLPAYPYPVLIDMGTSAITYGDMMVAIANNTCLPEDVALDAEGTPTCNPQKALQGAILPFGGHKGSALALAVQILSGLFVNAAAIPQPGKDYGILMIGIQPNVFISKQQYFSEIMKLIQHIKSSNKIQGVDEILIPGERSFNGKQRRIAEGIEIDAELIEKINSL